MLPQEQPVVEEPPKKKIPVGAQPLFLVGAKMVLPHQKQEDGTTTAVTVDPSAIQSQVMQSVMM